MIIAIDPGETIGVATESETFQVSMEEFPALVGNLEDMEKITIAVIERPSSPRANSQYHVGYCQGVITAMTKAEVVFQKPVLRKLFMDKKVRGRHARDAKAHLNYYLMRSA